MECDTGETTHNDHCQSSIFSKPFDAGIRQLDNKKHNNVLKCINNSWVNVNTKKSLDISVENEPFVEKCRAAIAESQKVLFIIFIIFYYYYNYIFFIIIINNFFLG